MSAKDGLFTTLHATGSHRLARARAWLRATFPGGVLVLVPAAIRVCPACEIRAERCQCNTGAPSPFTR